jgi:hypothetical protein
MKITYDKYKLGDEFEHGSRRGKLIQIGYDKIALLITKGGDKDCIWTWGTEVNNTHALTDDDVSKALGSSVEWKPVNSSEPTINIEVTEDELKVLWGRLNVATPTIEHSLKQHGLKEVDSCKHDMWKEVNTACIDIGLKNQCGKFND